MRCKWQFSERRTICADTLTAELWWLTYTDVRTADTCFSRCAISSESAGSSRRADCKTTKSLPYDRSSASYAGCHRTSNTNTATSYVWVETLCSLTGGTSVSTQYAGSTFSAEQSVDGGVSFVRNVGTSVPDCMVSHLTRAVCYYLHAMATQTLTRVFRITMWWCDRPRAFGNSKDLYCLSRHLLKASHCTQVFGIAGHDI